jgi:hypothetical protein
MEQFSVNLFIVKANLGMETLAAILYCDLTFYIVVSSSSPDQPLCFGARTDVSAS